MLGSKHNPGLFLCHTTGRFQLFKSLTSIVKILSQNYNPKQYVSTQKTPTANGNLPCDLLTPFLILSHTKL